VELDSYIVDSITLQSLEEHYKISKEALDSFYSGEGWLHRNDIENLSVLMCHLREVIDYYGGSTE